MCLYRKWKCQSFVRFPDRLSRIFGFLTALLLPEQVLPIHARLDMSPPALSQPPHPSFNYILQSFLIVPPKPTDSFHTTRLHPSSINPTSLLSLPPSPPHPPSRTPPTKLPTQTQAKNQKNLLRILQLDIIRTRRVLEQITIMRRPLHRIRMQRVPVLPVLAPRRIRCDVACEGVAD